MERIWYGSYDARVPHSADYPEKCLPLLLEEITNKYADQVALEFLGASWTYRSFWKHVLSLANAFHRMGVGNGTKVAVMLPNCPQSVIAYYAALWAGAVVVMTNPLYVEREMERQWKSAEVEALVVLDHLYPKVEKVLPRTSLRQVVVTSIREYLPWYLKLLYPLKAWKKKLFTAVPYGGKISNFSRLIAQHSPTPPPCTTRLDDLALLQYTGGTTGLSKGVMLSHRNILSNVVQLSSWFPDLRWGGERFLAVLPFSHVLGMTACMNLPLYCGSSCHIQPRFDLDELLRTLQKQRISLFPGVPTIFTAILNHPGIKSYDLSSIRFCITGAAPMPLEVIRRFESITGSMIIEGYGLTEASPVTHCNPITEKRKPGSIGICLPDTDCKIMDLEEGIHPMPLGESGELVIRGPQVMQGYWQMPEETNYALREGWLYTGDVATMDPEGFVFIVDRKKDMIISGGYNIYPREIDEVLYEHPAVLDAVAVGIPDPYRGETVKAYVVKKPGHEVKEKEIIDFCKARLAVYKVPKSVEFRESLPKTMVGKVLRKELRMESLKKSGSSEKS